MRLTLHSLSTRILTWPLASTGAARGHTSRTALLGTLATDATDTGFSGEAAPLPGRSRDTIADAAAAMAGLAALLPMPVPVTLEEIAALVARITAAPAARFALETALLSARAFECGVPVRALLAAGAADSVPVAFVVDDEADARAAIAHGASCLKIKVGTPDDVDRVARIARVSGRLPLRLDANQAWQRAEVAARLAALAAVSSEIEWIEEPCENAHELLGHDWPLPLALDESLASMSATEIEAALGARGLAAVMLKPTLLGGFGACLALARRARVHGVDAVVTHALEGPVGTAACVELAKAIGSTRAAGIGPHPACARIATVASVAEVAAALEDGRPFAVVHHRLPAAEQERQRAEVARACVPEGTAAVLFTSGSTGSARGVAISQRAIAAAVAASAEHLGWRDDDRWLLALSLAHAGGLAVIARCRAAGKPIEVVGDGGSLAPHLARCTLASLVPTQLVALLEDPTWQSPPRLRAVLLGGAAAPRALLVEAAQRGVPVLRTYGMTETFGQIATTALTSAGDPDAPLVPLRGVTIAAGTPHEPAAIRVRAPMLATAYLDGTPIGSPDGWFTTSDLGYLDAAGALHIVGRADDVIISGGEKVHPLAVEAVLAATPGVTSACAFGIPDPRWGQITAAAITVGRDFERTAAIECWHAALPAHARPRELAITTALPQSVTGKLDRRAAAELPREPVCYPSAT